MFLFIRLVLAHFIGDFPLQLNKVYELKHKGLKGGIPHAFLVFLSLLILSWPYLNIPSLWGLIFIVGVLHLFQDSIKISYGKIKYSFWLYLLDQIVHIVTIAAAVFLTGLKNLPRPRSAGLPVSLYNNDILIIYLIAIIIATYNGFHLGRNFRNTFFGDPGVYSPFEKWYGMLERGGIVTIFLLKGLFFFLIPIILLIRPLIFYIGKNKIDIHEQFVSPQEMALTWIIAGITGASLYAITSLL